MKTLRVYYSTGSQAGFTLLEVLVALLVLSIGLLGLAALQTLSLKFNHQSYERTQAVIRAYDMLDRIRANPLGKKAGAYDLADAGSIPTIAKDCTTAASPPGCTPAELATYDIAKWQTDTANLLNKGTGAIETSAAVRTITITWTENDVPMKLIVEGPL
jgi:type IV pilus assembly protein PilV